MYANICIRNETSVTSAISFEASALEWFSQLLLDNHFQDDVIGFFDDEGESEPICSEISTASERLEARLMAKHIQSGRIKYEQTSSDVTPFHRYRYTFQKPTTMATNSNLGLMRSAQHAATSPPTATFTSNPTPPPNYTPTRRGRRHRSLSSEKVSTRLL